MGKHSVGLQVTISLAALIGLEAIDMAAATKAFDLAGRQRLYAIIHLLTLEFVHSWFCLLPLLSF